MASARRGRRVRGAGDAPAPVSFAAIALWVVGAGVAGLALTAAAVALLPLAPAGRALVLLAGIVLTVVAMAAASNRITARAIRAEFGDDDADAPAAGGSGADDRRGPGDGPGRATD